MNIFASETQDRVKQINAALSWKETDWTQKGIRFSIQDKEEGLLVVFFTGGTHSIFATEEDVYVVSDRTCRILHILGISYETVWKRKERGSLEINVS